MHGKEEFGCEGEAEGEVQRKRLPPVPTLWTGESVSTEVRDVPDLFQGRGAARRDPRSPQGELVKGAGALL